MAMGQAAGFAAAISADQGRPPRKIDVAELRKILAAQGASLEHAYWHNSSVAQISMRLRSTASVNRTIGSWLCLMRLLRDYFSLHESGK